MRPQNHEILYAKPWTGTWEQIRDDGSKVLADLIRKLGLKEVELGLADFYREWVRPDDLPTDDLLWAWKRDLETHGKIITTLYTNLDDRNEFEQICIWIVNRWGDGDKMEVVWFGDELLQKVREVSKAAQEEDA